MRLADLDYALPRELIAQEPPAARTDARLLVVPRDGGPRRDAHVADLPALLRAGDLLVLNDTRVIPARVHGRRPSGGRLEVLFVRPAGRDDTWDVLVRGTPRPGERVHLPDADGEVPLPPYIDRPAGPSAGDRDRYQTVYARTPGAVAAPTAGLHFTPELLAAVARAGVATATLTLHVGPGTFQPIRVDELAGHEMAPERYVMPPETVAAVVAARAGGGRVVAVGTTTVRALESAAADGGLAAGAGEARLFIHPGHRFRVVDALLTNFHLPRSPLLALVAAFAGWETIRNAYEAAVAARYRFYSFGDAMLIS